MVAVALIGDPVAHSISPAIHRAAFEAAGLDWNYQLVRVPDGELGQAWPGLAGRFVGLNVTTPHKRTAALLADQLSPTARLCASVNTITFGPRGGFGDSTDGAGFLAALRRRAGGLPGVAVMVGTGGAARAVAAALAGEGVEVRVVGRNRQAGAQLGRELGAVGPGTVAFLGTEVAALESSLAGAGLLVNATPLGGLDALGLSPLPEGVGLDPSVVVFDLIYRPRRTRLLCRAVAQGCVVVEGVDMLVEQGALSFEAWTGINGPIEVMRQAAALALESQP